MSGDLVQNLKRAGEQVLGAKPLTGNDHVRLSALLKVAALELEALCAARNAAPDLLEALEMIRDADEDCRRDGLPTIPYAPRKKIDAAIAKARGEQS